MASRVAWALGDAGARAALLVAAVKRDTDDDALVAEADLAVVEHGDPDLAAKLDAAASPEARALAHLRLAEERERQGRDSEAIAALTRVRGAPNLDAGVKGRATAQLQRLLSQSGRDEDAEVFLRAELARRSLPPAARRRVAHDLADLFLRRDDPRSAFSVLASLESEGGPPDRDLLAELRGLARATDDVGRYAAVLEDALKRALGDVARLEILRELAPLYTELGDGERAAACYEEIARLDPADAQALELLERAANERGDHAAIAALLARRIALSPAGDKKRMLRLRRAAVLEQRLGLLDDAAEELGALLAEAPDDVSALRFLADVHERRGALFAAAELLERLEATSTTSEEKAEYGLRAAAAYLGDGKAELAERSLASVASIAQREAVLELRVEIARRTGDARALVDALDELAASPGEPAERRAALLVEAARAASASGDDAGATSRARRAVKLAPSLADAVLEARRLELKGGGAGAPREAQAAVDELLRIEPRLASEQIELYAFLLAEELDVIQGGGAGMRELTRRHAEVGPLPLIALGMAERMVRGKSFDAALPLFEQALAGDLRGMRSRGRVALAAAEAAAHAQAFTAAAAPPRSRRLRAGDPGHRPAPPARAGRHHRRPDDRAPGAGGALAPGHGPRPRARAPAARPDPGGGRARARGGAARGGGAALQRGPRAAQPDRRRARCRGGAPRRAPARGVVGPRPGRRRRRRIRRRTERRRGRGRRARGPLGRRGLRPRVRAGGARGARGLRARSARASGGGARGPEPEPAPRIVAKLAPPPLPAPREVAATTLQRWPPPSRRSRPPTTSSGAGALAREPAAAGGDAPEACAGHGRGRRAAPLAGAQRRVVRGRRAAPRPLRRAAGRAGARGARGAPAAGDDPARRSRGAQAAGRGERAGRERHLRALDRARAPRLGRGLARPAAAAARGAAARARPGHRAPLPARRRVGGPRGAGAGPGHGPLPARRGPVPAHRRGPRAAHRRDRRSARSTAWSPATSASRAPRSSSSARPLRASPPPRSRSRSSRRPPSS